MAGPTLRFDEYWLLFVRAHQSRVVRTVQAVAVTAGVGCAVLGVATRRLAFVLAAPVIAVGSTWIARRVVGGAGVVSLPLHPAFHARAMLKMWTLTLASAMDAEVARVTNAPREEPSEAPEDERPHPPPNMVTDHTLH